MKNAERINVSDNVPIEPVESQFNRYNMTLPQSFSVYNNEGNVLYRGEVEQVANQLRAELFGIEPPVVEKPIVLGYTKKRSFFLIVPLILTALILAVAIVGLFKTSINGYVALYGYEYAVTKDVVLLDPLFSFLQSQFKLDLGNFPAEFATLAKPVEDGNVMGAIAKYALPVSIVLYVVFALIALITAIVGLAGRKQPNGTYKRAKFGFLSIVMFVCALLMAVAGVYATGGKIGDVANFITRANPLFAGIGYYAFLAIPVILFVCTCLAYGKTKPPKAEEKVLPAFKGKKNGKKKGNVEGDEALIKR